MAVRSKFWVVNVTSEEEGHKAAELLDPGPQARGWMSAKYCIFPQVLIVALDTRSIIEKLQLLNHAFLISTKIEIHLGDVPKGKEVDMKNSYFMHIGTLDMDNNKDNNQTARQMRSVEVSPGAKSCPVTFVKLVFHKNYQNRKNQHNQVSLVGLNIFGEPVRSFENSDRFAVDNEVPPNAVSPYDDLAFLIYTDTEVVELILKLEAKKQEAVQTERFEFAKKVKSTIRDLGLSGQKLATLEMEKSLLVGKQDYEGAKEKTEMIDETRMTVYKMYQELDMADQATPIPPTTPEVGSSEN